MAKPRIRESDLYPPLKRFLEAQGYAVKGEVNDCDAVAVRGGEEPVVVELKASLNLKALMQAAARLTLTRKVYVGVAHACPVLARDRRGATKLLKMLGLGLVVIDPRPSPVQVAVLLDPGEYRPRRAPRKTERLLGEFERRVGDPNLGGADRRRGIMTAYRQRVLRVADYLAAHGPTKASDVARALDEPKARELMYADVYGWFEREGAGVYRLSPRGDKDVVQWLGESDGDAASEPAAPAMRRRKGG
jgi:hypothetical protein